MKKILIFLLIPCIAWTQEKRDWLHPFISKSDVALYSLQGVSGFASGMGDALVYHPHTMERILGGNLDWWIPSRSQGRGGWVMTRDGIHMTRGFEHMANYASIGVAALSFSDFKGLSKGQCLLLAGKKIVISSAINRALFVVSYRYIFNDNPERIKAGLDPH